MRHTMMPFLAGVLFFGGCTTTRHYYVDTTQFEKAKATQGTTQTAIPAVTPMGEQVSIWSHEVKRPDTRDTRCLNELGQSEETEQCLELERVTYEALDWKKTGQRMFWGGLASIPITILAFPFIWKSEAIPLDLWVAAFWVGAGSMLTGPFIYFANDAPTPRAPGPSPGFPERLGVPSSKPIGVSFSGSF